VLFDLARKAGKNHNSVLIYSEYSEVIEPVGKGCMALIGDVIDPIMIEIAREQAGAIRIPLRMIDIESTATTLRFIFQPGNGLMDTGVMPISVGLAARLGDRVFTIVADGATPGELKVANSSNVLVSLTSAFSALRVEPVDVMKLRGSADRCQCWAPSVSVVDESCGHEHGGGEADGGVAVDHVAVG